MEKKLTKVLFSIAVVLSDNKQYEFYPYEILEDQAIF